MTPRRIGILLALSASVASTAVAQGSSIGIGVSRILAAGDGVKSGCDLRSYSTGFGATVAVPIFRKVLAAATGRVYPLSRGPTCFTDIFVPSNGTYTIDDLVTLQSTRFATSDLRLQLSPVAPLTVALGGGLAWHPGPEFPYLVGATMVRFPPSRRFQFSIGAEYYLVRSSWNETSVTYVNSVPVNSVPLGRRHKWSPALALAVSASLTK